MSRAPRMPITTMCLAHIRDVGGHHPLCPGAPSCGAPVSANADPLPGEEHGTAGSAFHGPACEHPYAPADPSAPTEPPVAGAITVPLLSKAELREVEARAEREGREARGAPTEPPAAASAQAPIASSTDEELLVRTRHLALCLFRSQLRTLTRAELRALEDAAETAERLAQVETQEAHARAHRARVRAHLLRARIAELDDRPEDAGHDLGHAYFYADLAESHEGFAAGYRASYRDRVGGGLGGAAVAEPSVAHLLGGLNADDVVLVLRADSEDAIERAEGIVDVGAPVQVVPVQRRPVGAFAAVPTRRIRTSPGRMARVLDRSVEFVGRALAGSTWEFIGDNVSEGAAEGDRGR